MFTISSLVFIRLYKVNLKSCAIASRHRRNVYQAIVTFDVIMIDLNFQEVQLKLRRQDEKTQVFDPVRKRWVALTPEEHVRQYLLQYLTRRMNYPASLISVEKKIDVGGMPRRFDIVVYGRQHEPWLMAECKAPDVVITEATLFQLLHYQRSTPCNYWLLSNGHQTFCADACDRQHIKWRDALPPYGT